MAVEPANPCDPEPGLALPSRHKGRRKTRNRSSVKTHRNYTVEEVARAMGIAKGTIRRWIRSGNLPALMDRKPHLIIGGDLIDYLKGRAIKRVKLPLHECYCFKCRAARPPALAMADYIPLTPTTGNLRAICGTCYSLMHKAVRLAALTTLAGILSVSVRQGPASLIDTSNPSPSDHFPQEGEPNA